LELVSFKAEPRLVVILDQLVSKGVFISRSALIRFALWNKLASEIMDDLEQDEDPKTDQKDGKDTQILEELTSGKTNSQKTDF
jgi:Arc/MetJ-type ribon-helix-helix transcriptional regulator